MKEKRGCGGGEGLAKIKLNNGNLPNHGSVEPWLGREELKKTISISLSPFSFSDHPFFIFPFFCLFQSLITDSHPSTSFTYSISFYQNPFQYP